MSQPLIEVRGLKKSFPIHRGVLRRHVGDVRAVDGVDMTLGRQETFALVGESGCGKTTAGRSLLRLVEPTAGSARYWAKPDEPPVELFELGRRELRRVRKDLSIIFQDPYASLNPRLSIGEAIGEGLRVHGLARGPALRERVADLLHRVGLRPDWAGRYPHEFSGGQRQRVGIARALALEPKLIVCDEAVSALDVSIQAQIVNLLGDLSDELGLSYLFIAHDLSVVRLISDRVGVMYLGRIVEQGTADQVFGDPKHPYTQALLSAIPEVDPSRRRGRVVLRGDVPSPSDPPPGCAFQTRCPQAEERCRIEYPVTRDTGAGQLVACHLVDGQELPRPSSPSDTP